MKIKTEMGEFEFFSEDLRHFKIDSPEDLAKFIKIIGMKKKSVGFKKENKK